MINFMSNQVPSQRSIMSTNGWRSIVVIKQENISMQNSDHSQTVSTCPTYFVANQCEKIISRLSLPQWGKL